MLRKPHNELKLEKHGEEERENQQCKKRFSSGGKIVVLFELSFVKGERNFNNICDMENS